MKTYMYDVESGIYEGEAFEDVNIIKYVEGLTSSAPPILEQGMVPVFNKSNQTWSLVPITEMKERLSIGN